MDKCVIWARVSSREQREEGYTVDQQRKDGEKYAKEKDFRIARRFNVAESAKGDKPRIIFNEMMEYVREHKIKVIICDRIDRITRNLKDSTILYDWLNEDEDRQIHFTRNRLIVHKNSKTDAKFRWDIEVVMAKRYSDDLSEKVKGGTNEKAEQGWYPGPHKRGYLSIRPEGQKRAIWIKDESEESELAHIKKACELYAYEDYTLKTLCRHMYEEYGWKQKDGRPIAKSTMAKIVADPFFCGWFKWKNKLYKDANHEGVITPETHLIIKEKLQRKYHTKYRKHMHLFKNLIHCGECGCSITSEVQKGHIYYHCTRYKPCGQRKYTREEDIEKQVIEEFDKMEIKNKKMLNWLIKALKESHQAKIDTHQRALDNLNAQYNRAGQRIDKIYLDNLDGKISDEKYDELSKKFKDEQEEVKNKIVRHERASEKYFELGINILKVAKLAKKIYLNRSLEEKRQLLQLVFSNLALKDGILLTLKEKPFQLIAERAQNQNWSG